MASELAGSYVAGANAFAILRNQAGQVWNGSAFASWSDGSFASYPIAATEQGTSGDYYADMPAAIVTAGYYNYAMYARQGGSPVLSDLAYRFTKGEIKWNGTALATPQTDLNAISPTALTGVASTWVQKVDALWRYFYKRALMTGVGSGSGTIVTYADDGSTVLTTQALTETTTTQNRGAAS